MIPGRIEKEYSNKIFSEVFLFLAMLECDSLLKRDFERACGVLSPRTVSRYIQDIADCGYVPKIRIDGRQFWVDYSSDPRTEDEEKMIKIAPTVSDEPHLVRLSRICEILVAFGFGTRSEWEWYEEEPPEGFTVDGVWAWYNEAHADAPVSRRTIRRDMLVISDVLRAYTDVLPNW